jgi:hypothetical protein
MGERITIAASDGFILNAYRAVPEGTPRGGVVVIQEVWGLNHWVRSVVDRFARHGYLAVAPAMFDRVQFGYESDNYGPEQFVVIGELMKKFDHGTALLDVAAAIQRRIGLLWRWRAHLYRLGAGHSAGNALWRSGHRHSARAGGGAKGPASCSGHSRLCGRARLLQQ